MDNGQVRPVFLVPARPPRSAEIPSVVARMWHEKRPKSSQLAAEYAAAALGVAAASTAHGGANGATAARQGTRLAGDRPVRESGFGDTRARCSGAGRRRAAQFRRGRGMVGDWPFATRRDDQGAADGDDVEVSRTPSRASTAGARVAGGTRSLRACRPGSRSLRGHVQTR